MTKIDLNNLVLEALHRSQEGYRSLVRDIARDHPDIPAPHLEAALQAVARQLDANLIRAGAPTDEARLARRLAVLIGMDIDVLSAAARGPPTLGQLMAHWVENDDFFLRL